MVHPWPANFYYPTQCSFQSTVAVQSTQPLIQITAYTNNLHIAHHRPSSKMSFCACGSCDRWFGNYHSRTQHLNATGHSIPAFECDTCPRFFRSRRAVEQHMDATGHWDYPYECRAPGCEDAYKDEEDRDEHEVEDCLYCADCDKSFQNINNIRMHFNSRLHRPADVKCPFCEAKYTSATGLCHHLEMGSCPGAPRLNRDEIYKFVRSKDPGGIVSKKLLGWHGSPTYEATLHAWDGHGYRCYLCHRSFHQLQSLNQHLSSPVHQQALYHCPNRYQCGKEFTSLAGVINHIESESCGFTRFDTVKRNIKDVVSGNKLIAMG